MNKNKVNISFKKLMAAYKIFVVFYALHVNICMLSNQGIRTKGDQKACLTLQQQVYFHF